MIFISHRGNLTGAVPNYENNWNYIQYALNHGFDVEIDVWYVDGIWYLGHDVASFPVKEELLIKYQKSLWIHCKNKFAIRRLMNIPKMHFFWHQEDDYSLTSKNWVISYPGIDAAGEFSVAMCPERFLIGDAAIKMYLEIQKFDAVCSDNIELIKNFYK